MIEEVLGRLYIEADRQPGAINQFLAGRPLTIHSIYFGTTHLFQIRPVPHVTDLLMHVLDGSVEGGA